MQKHNAPLKRQSAEKKIGCRHLNDDESNAPAIGVPSSQKFSEKFGRNGKSHTN
jgi:hypothetical protein